MCCVACPPKISPFWAAVTAPQEPPNHPYLTCRAVYQVLVRRSKACWRALVGSGRSAHVGKASTDGCTSCRMRRARVPHPHRRPRAQSSHTMWVMATPQLLEAHAATSGVPDNIPQG